MTTAPPSEKLYPAPPAEARPTWEIAYLFPEQGEWSETEYLALDTNRLVEFTDGVLEVLHTANEAQPPEELRTAYPTLTWEVAYLFPEQGEWSETEYMFLRPSRQVEFTDGYIEVLPVPKQSHQLILDFLLQALRAFVLARKLGKVLFAPLRVQIRPGKFREPDIVFMKTEHADRLGEEFWVGADLVVEIVSDDARSRERDLEKKRADYAEAGIPEYWIVDPIEERITVLRLAGQQYETYGEFTRGAQAASALLAGFAVEVNAILDAGRI